MILRLKTAKDMLFFVENGCASIFRKRENCVVVSVLQDSFVGAMFSSGVDDKSSIEKGVIPPLNTVSLTFVPLNERKRNRDQWGNDEGINMEENEESMNCVSLKNMFR